LLVDFLPVAGDVGEPMQGMYWRSGQRMLSSAYSIARDHRLHAVYITNFSCGPDSFILKHIHREMGGKPWLLIELDEHSADAGVVTRLEAFYDSLFSPSARKPQAAVFRRASAPDRNGGTPATVYIPYMDDHGIALAAAMRHYGINGQALPVADETSLALGRRYTSGRECYPCIITTGDILKKALCPNFDPARDGFFMATAMGPCRFGQYRQFHRMVLDDLGFQSVPLVVLDQTTQYEGCLKRLGANFRKLGWQALVLIDYLKKLLLQSRPYEVRSGDSDAAYAECLGRICTAIETQGSIAGCAAYAARRFAGIVAHREEIGTRPLIGIVGEIFVRSNPFSNNSIVRTIEALGGEVVVPPLQEWVQYTDWERRKDLLRKGAWKSCAREVVTGLVQQRCVVQIRRHFAGHTRHFFKESSTRHVMDLSKSYLSEHIRGEATLSMGRAVEYARHGCHGLVNLAPFNCLPGTIVNTLLCRFSQMHPGLPVLKMVYDGSSRAGDQLRIEAFVHQARQALEATRRRC
jgi:predicted nucleotide-binding protein (sugar kinase/HSP70/actin superfamily)